MLKKIILYNIRIFVNGRNRHNTTLKSRKKYDLFYSEKISLKLDLQIIVWTIKVLIKDSY